jgi:FKBP-type peptidyl-prolyl cis-trans isomerase (trigger factor)
VKITDKFKNMIMENLNELKAIIYNNMLKEVFDIINEDCRNQIIKNLDEKMANYKELAMNINMDIEDVRTKYVIYSDLKKLI